MGWRYVATRMNGDGTETPLSFDVPLRGLKITDDLSGPGGLSGTISPELERLKNDAGEPVFVPWSTAIYAEADGRLRGGAILKGFTEQGPVLSMDCMGFTSYLQGEPYTGDYSKVQIDPLDVVRHIWEHRQSKRSANLGVTVDDIQSPVRIGNPAEDVAFETSAGTDVAFEAGPYTLAWWKTKDLGKELDDLALATPFDYRMVHEWDGETIRHRLVLGYPQLGRRRDDLRFVVGENVHIEPEITRNGEDYASEILILGAGEGRKMVRGIAPRATDRLHRTIVLEDKTLQSRTAADRAALAELNFRLGDEDISELEVLNHPHAPIGSYGPGDDIFIQTAQGWSGGVDLWVRILSIATEPERDRSVLSVTRVEKV